MTRIALSLLRLDFQKPENLSEEIVQEKLQQIVDGETLEPVLVCFDGGSYFLLDGFHRVEAACRYGMAEIDAEIRSGTFADAEAEWRANLEAIKADLRAGGPSRE